jgi:hypothetical protein
MPLITNVSAAYPASIVRRVAEQSDSQQKQRYMMTVKSQTLRVLPE